MQFFPIAISNLNILFNIYIIFNILSEYLQPFSTWLYNYGRNEVPFSSVQFNHFQKLSTIVQSFITKSILGTEYANIDFLWNQFKEAMLKSNKISIWSDRISCTKAKTLVSHITTLLIESDRNKDKSMIYQRHLSNA